MLFNINGFENNVLLIKNITNSISGMYKLNNAKVFTAESSFNLLGMDSVVFSKASDYPFTAYDCLISSRAPIEKINLDYPAGTTFKLLNGVQGDTVKMNKRVLNQTNDEAKSSNYERSVIDIKNIKSGQTVIVRSKDSSGLIDVDSTLTTISYTKTDLDSGNGLSIVIDEDATDTKNKLYIKKKGEDDFADYPHYQYRVTSNDAGYSEGYFPFVADYNDDGVQFFFDFVLKSPGEINIYPILKDITDFTKSCLQIQIQTNALRIYEYDAVGTKYTIKSYSASISYDTIHSANFRHSYTSGAWALYIDGVYYSSAGYTSTYEDTNYLGVMLEKTGTYVENIIANGHVSGDLIDKISQNTFTVKSGAFVVDSGAVDSISIEVVYVVI